MKTIVSRGFGVLITALLVICSGCGSGKETGSAKSNSAMAAEPPGPTILEKLHSDKEGDRVNGAKEAVEKFGAKSQEPRQ